MCVVVTTHSKFICTNKYRLVKETGDVTKLLKGDLFIFQFFPIRYDYFLSQWEKST